jgi:hypothetical protein
MFLNGHSCKYPLSCLLRQYHGRTHPADLYMRIYAANNFEECPTLQCVMNFTGRTRLSNQLGVAGIFMKETETAG